MPTRGVLVVCAVLLAAWLALALAHSPTSIPPRVHRVDPPNWWVGLPSPMLLINGDGLCGATVSVESSEAKVTRLQQSPDCHYLFVWLDTTRSRAGKVRLLVRTPNGTGDAGLELQQRKALSGTFGGFGEDDVIYLIMPDRFADGDPGNNRPPDSRGTYDRANPKAYHGGDLRGIRQHLAYLHDLGVSTLWLTPAWKNANSDYHGYHVVDFYAVDYHMGSLREYQELVRDAHKLGMKVLIDYVVNHTGPEHPWVQDPPSPSWFHGTPAQHLAPVYNFSALIDPHAPPSEKRGTLEGWFVDRLPDLNNDNPLLSQYLLDNAMWWTEETGLDGFRLDTFPYSSRAFWSEWLEKFHEVYPRIDSVGEVSDPDVAITSFFAGGRKQFDGVDTRVSTIFDYPLYYALREVLLGNRPVQRLIDVLQRDWMYSHPEMLVTFFGNHDKPRFAGEAGSSTEKLTAAFSLLLTLRGVPQIYYGDEIGMTGGDDPDNRRDFPGGFPGDSHNAFRSSGRSPDEQEIFSHVQALLRLRAAHPALRRGHQWHIGWDDTYYAFVRECSEEKLLIVFNNAAGSRDITLATDETPLQGAHGLEKLFGEGAANIDRSKVLVSIPSTAVSIYRVQ